MARPALEAHPIIHKLDLLLRAEGLGVKDFSRLSGLSTSTLCRWWKAYDKDGKSPSLAKIDKALDALGYELKVSPKT